MPIFRVVRIGPNVIAGCSSSGDHLGSHPVYDGTVEELSCADPPTGQVSEGRLYQMVFDPSTKITDLATNFVLLTV